MIFSLKKSLQYDKSLKVLKKRFRNIEKDVDNFLDSISSINELGVLLKPNIYKARISNSNKKSGKSAGYRLITYLKIVDNELYLLYIYDKSDFENVSESEIDALFANHE